MQPWLSNLTLSSGTLSPTFSNNISSYTTNVANATNSVSVTAVFANANATAKVNGTTVLSGTPSGAIPLAVGAKTINVVVTAPDASTKTYTVTVYRAVQATYTSGTVVPVNNVTGYTAAGNNIGFTLSYAPAVGTTLMVVKNTGLNFIGGTFNNLAQGQAVKLSFGGTVYHFVANYYGGTGNDLVLQWADVRPVAWGLGTSGQLGNNGYVNSTLPGPVNTAGVNGSALFGRTIMALSKGAGHSMALCSDGKIITWGANDSGQLGDNTFIGSPLPVQVKTQEGLQVLSGKTVAAVAAGNYHNLALCSDGTLAAWGLNTNGQLGDNSTTTSAVPVAVDRTAASGPKPQSALFNKTVIAVSAGASHSLALCSDGTVAAWGSCGSGELGNGSNIGFTQRNVPVQTTTQLGSAAKPNHNRGLRRQQFQYGADRGRHGGHLGFRREWPTRKRQLYVKR